MNFSFRWLLAFLMLSVAVYVGVIINVSKYDRISNDFPLCKTKDGTFSLCSIGPLSTRSIGFIHKMKGAFFYFLTSFVEWSTEKILLAMARTSLPDYSVNVTLSHATLSHHVKIERDTNGIPSVYARTLRDGIVAQGFLQGQDRLYQLDVQRKICSGKLSELFGEKALGTDRLARVFGFNQHKESNFSQSPVHFPDAPFTSRIDTLDHVNAFIDGLNAYITSEHFKKPAEFRLLGISNIEPFSLDDILCWARFNYFVMAKGWTRELAMSLMISTIGDIGKDFFVEYSDFFPSGTLHEEKQARPSEFLRKGSDSVKIGKGGAFPSAENLDLPSSEFGGSNAFVISGEHTTSGKPFLLGDPHLPAIQPATWHRWNLFLVNEQDESTNIYTGVSTTLIPFFITSKTNHFSTSVTLANIDIDDTFVVRFCFGPHGTLLYDYNGDFIEPIVRTERIICKGTGHIEEIRVLHTRYGVIISDELGLKVTEEGIVGAVGLAGVEEDLDSESSPFHYKLALRSSALHTGHTRKDNIDYSVLGFLGNAMVAQSMEEYEAAISFCPVPPLNFLYADVEGNIAHFITGRLPKREGISSGILPSKSWLQENQWDTYCSWDEMPKFINPAEGFLVSANHKSFNVEPVLNSWGQGYRALRITRMIEDAIGRGGKISPEKAKSFQRDTLSLVGLEFKAFFFHTPDILLLCDGNSLEVDAKILCDALALFESWDGHTDAESSAACIFEVLYQMVLYDLFQSAVGAENLDLCLGKGFNPVISPSSEILLALPTILLKILDAEIPAYDSPFIVNMETPSPFWMKASGGVESLMKRNFIRSVRWLANTFADRHDVSEYDVSSWKWGEIHQTRFKHNLGVISPLVDRVISPRIPASGDGDTVSMSQVVPFKFSFDQMGWGVSYRQFNDMSEGNTGESILPPGNSGSIGAIGYSSTLQPFHDGKLFQNIEPAMFTCYLQEEKKEEEEK